MDFDSVLRYCEIGVLLFIAALVIYKLLSIQIFMGRHDTRIPVRLFSKYNHVEVYGTDSYQQRKFLQTSNKLTSYLWFFLILFLLLVALPFIKTIFDTK